MKKQRNVDLDHLIYEPLAGHLLISVSSAREGVPCWWTRVKCQALTPIGTKQLEHFLPVHASRSSHFGLSMHCHPRVGVM